MKRNTNLLRRGLFYLLGFLIMTMGIAVTVKSGMGTTPVAALPYTMTCIWGIEMGRATILVHTALVLVQLLLLRKRFKPVNLLQVPVGVLFGAFTTFCNGLMTAIPNPQSLPLRLMMTLLGIFLLAFGVFLYVPTGFVPLAVEGAVLAIADVTGAKFSTVKVAFDSTLVAISLIACLIVLHRPGSVGVGTVAAALLVGTVIRFLTARFGAVRDKLLGLRKDAAQ